MDHDFPTSAESVVYPHGFYDPIRNVGHINLGTSHRVMTPVTSPATASAIGGRTTGERRIRTRLRSSCCATAAAAIRHVVTSSNITWSNWRPAFSWRFGWPTIRRVVHKHDPIEHRFFPHVTRACQGVIFTTIDLAREKMAETSTRPGLRTTVEILAGNYPIGEKVPAGYKKSMRIAFDEELPAWNYRAIPVKPGS